MAFDADAASRDAIFVLILYLGRGTAIRLLYTSRLRAICEIFINPTNLDFNFCLIVEMVASHLQPFYKRLVRQIKSSIKFIQNYSSTS